MCGVAGFVGPPRPGEELNSLVSGMMGAVSHRGPDDAASWTDAGEGVALGHRRLAVLDLSPLGRQPMESHGRRFVIAYNGEIYNYREIASDLEPLGVTFRGRSDTEVLLAAVEQWGLEAALGRTIGMFAFALWDRKERSLTLVRDRLGIKPMYYGWRGETFLFGSELAALIAYPGFDRDLDRQALTGYLRYGYVAAPRSVFTACRKLEPGTMLTVDGGSPGSPRRRVYWDARSVAAAAAEEGWDGKTEAQAQEELDALLSDAVNRRLVSDVPLGAFLSGGIDSSLVVSLMQKQVPEPIRTFTIGNEDASHDEAEDARRVAEHLGCRHTELTLGPRAILETVAEMPAAYSEPFGDASQIPTWLVSRLAREHVTVVLSGDGGDELFAGYNRYLWGTRLWNRLSPIPFAARRSLAGVVDALFPPALDPVYSRVGNLLPRKRRIPLPGEKARKLSGLLRAPDARTLHAGLMSHWSDPAAAVIGGKEAGAADPEPGDPLRGMMLEDLTGYLPEDVLTKVDRASMQFALEVRVPLLDHRLVAFAWRLPTRFKIRGSENKWILRRVLDRYVPRSLVDRGKAGFAVPVAAWLRGPLREWGEDLLAEDRLRRDGILDPAAVLGPWREHVAGRRDHHRGLWNVLMLQAWYERWGRAAPSGPAPGEAIRLQEASGAPRSDA